MTIEKTGLHGRFEFYPQFRRESDGRCLAALLDSPAGERTARLSEQEWQDLDPNSAGIPVFGIANG